MFQNWSKMLQKSSLKLRKLWKNDQKSLQNRALGLLGAMLAPRQAQGWTKAQFVSAKSSKKKIKVSQNVELCSRKGCEPDAWILLNTVFWTQFHVLSCFWGGQRIPNFGFPPPRVHVEPQKSPKFDPNFNTFLKGFWRGPRSGFWEPSSPFWMLFDLILAAFWEPLALQKTVQTVKLCS